MQEIPSRQRIVNLNGNVLVDRGSETERSAVGGGKLSRYADQFTGFRGASRQYGQGRGSAGIVPSGIGHHAAVNCPVIRKDGTGRGVIGIRRAENGRIVLQPLEGNR